MPAKRHKSNAHHTSAVSENRSIVGRDRLTWRKEGDQLLLVHGSDRKPFATVEPDSKYRGMYRIRFPDGGHSDMVNLTRAKDAALAFALRSLNSEAQETPPDALPVRQKRRPRVNTRQSAKRTHDPRTGFLAEGEV